jgi:hypothetical protein
MNRPAEAASLYKEIFGALPFAPGLFLSKVTLDTDGNTVPDFTDESRENGGKTSRWHGDGDGNLLEFAVTNSDGTVTKEALFRYDRGKAVTIRFENDSPVALTKDGITAPVARIAGTGHSYWIGDAALPPADQRRVAAALAALPPNTVSLTDYAGEDGSHRVFLAAIGEYRFGEVIDE